MIFEVKEQIEKTKRRIQEMEQDLEMSEMELEAILAYALDAVKEQSGNYLERYRSINELLAEALKLNEITLDNAERVEQERGSLLIDEQLPAFLPCFSEKQH